MYRAIRMSQNRKQERKFHENVSLKQKRKKTKKREFCENMKQTKVTVCRVEKQTSSSSCFSFLLGVETFWFKINQSQEKKKQKKLTKIKP